MRSIEIEIDGTGAIRPVNPEMKLPQGRAILTWAENEDLYPVLMSAKSLEDWLRPEEDEAWAYLQAPAKAQG